MQACKSFNLKYSILLIICLFSQFVEAANIDSLRAVIAADKRDTNQVDAYIHLCVAYLNLSYDSSLHYGLKANRLAKELGDQNRESASFLRVGNAYSFMAKYDSAAWAYQGAYEICVISEDYLNMGKALNNLGLMYRYMADYPKSLEYFIKSLEIKQKYGSTVDIGVANQNIGIVFAIEKEFDMAEQHMNKAIEAFRKSGDSSKYYSCVIDLSSLYRELKRYDKSIALLTKTYSYNKRTGNKTGMGICMYNLGLASYDNQDYEQSLVYYHDAKTIFTELGNVVRVLGCNIRISTIYLETNELYKAEQIALEALSVFPSLNSPVQEYEVHNLISKIYARQSRYKEAYEHKLKYEQLKDSIDLKAHNLKLIELQTKYQKEYNKREIAELTVQNDRNELKARQKAIEVYVLIGIIVLFLLLGIMIYFRFRGRQKVNEALREKTEFIQHSLDEKEVLLREIHHRVQNNLQFVSSLLNLQSRRVTDSNTLDVLKECKLRIQSMALIHQKLYQENSLKGINIQNYVANLLESLIQSYQIDTNKVRTEIKVDQILLDINTAIPIGLILNELITNSFKYAFENTNDGLLQIILREHKDSLVMEVIDNGPGIPEHNNFEDTNSFGMKLIKSLAQKLKADLQIDRLRGTRVIITIKEYQTV